MPAHPTFVNMFDLYIEKSNRVHPRILATSVLSVIELHLTGFPYMSIVTLNYLKTVKIINILISFLYL